MIEMVVHQIFWTLISFFLFFAVIRVFVINNVITIEKKRSLYIESLTSQIDSMRQKAAILRSVAHKILHEEIPSKQKFYVEKKLEPVLHELKILELNEKDELKEKLSRHNVRHFKKNILSQEKLKEDLEIAAKLLIIKMQGNEDASDKQISKSFIKSSNIVKSSKVSKASESFNSSGKSSKGDC